jgi:hypothetical protein
MFSNKRLQTVSKGSATSPTQQAGVHCHALAVPLVHTSIAQGSKPGSPRNGILFNFISQVFHLTALRSWLVRRYYFMLQRMHTSFTLHQFSLHNNENLVFAVSKMRDSKLRKYE